MERQELAVVELRQELSPGHGVPDADQEPPDDSRGAGADADLRADPRLDHAGGGDDRSDVAPRHPHHVRAPRAVLAPRRPSEQDDRGGDRSKDQEAQDESLHSVSPDSPAAMPGGWNGEFS